MTNEEFEEIRSQALAISRQASDVLGTDPLDLDELDDLSARARGLAERIRQDPDAQGA